ncbi:hypothetical protein MRB53_037776 [Persea americana]|nr:hypothetical protein MRB53_037776 [Persea americana]
MSAIIKSAAIFSGLGLTSAAILSSNRQTQTDFCTSALKASELDATDRETSKTKTIRVHGSFASPALSTHLGSRGGQQSQAYRRQNTIENNE